MAVRPELPTSTPGVFYSTFKCRLPAHEERAIGLELREGFHRIIGRLNREQTLALIDELIEGLEWVK